MKLYNHVSDFEMHNSSLTWPLFAFLSIFTICCSSRRKFERYENMIQQEKDKNEYLKIQLKSTKKQLIESYNLLLLHQQNILKEDLQSYEMCLKTYEKVKEFKLANDIEALQHYIFLDSSIEDIEDDWKKTVDLHYEKLEKQMKVFESVETKLKIAHF